MPSRTTVACCGHPDLHRVDVGEYRVVYPIEAHEVLVLPVGARNDDAVCKSLDRLRR